MPEGALGHAFTGRSIPGNANGKHFQYRHPSALEEKHLGVPDNHGVYLHKQRYMPARGQRGRLPVHKAAPGFARVRNEDKQDRRARLDSTYERGASSV